MQAQDRAGATASLVFRLLVMRDNRSDVVLSITSATNPVTVGEDARWNIDIQNKGPADLLDGQLFAGWIMSGPPLSVTAPQGCIVTGNGTSAPTMDCNVGLVAAGTSVILAVQGVQESDGDNSPLVAAVADDPNSDDNEVLAGMAVVAEFSEGPTQIVNAAVAAVRTGDLDGDGAIDIVATGDETIVFFNNGNRAVTTPGSSSLDLGSVGNVNAGDLNGDGAADLLVAIDGDNMSAPQNRVLYQQAGGTFSPRPSFGASPVAALVPGDIDADGFADIVAINEAGVHQVYLGAQGGGLSLAPAQIYSAGMRRGVLTDFNDDESLDLILAGSTAGVLETHANNGIGRPGLGDRIRPDIDLLGEVRVTIPAGQDYVDPGTTAVDDIDGDISDRIEVSGSIDSTVVGTQTITYSVADRAGNTASVTRTVVVGVNEGTGGGGAVAPLFAAVLLGLATARRTRRRN